MLDFFDNQESLDEFLRKHVKPYDPALDEYDRPPFAADIKEGKNDPIYNAHSYHTKVPPRSIIPYILHYTQPGDLLLDLFCGSGMTGVAAQMCASPPADILEQFPELPFQTPFLREQVAAPSKLLLHQDAKFLAEFAHSERIARRVIRKRTWPAVAQRQDPLGGNEKERLLLALPPARRQLGQIHRFPFPLNFAFSGPPDGPHPFAKIDIQKLWELA